MRLQNRLPIEEFELLKKRYNEENNRYEKTLIFHVGSEAGFYSEVGSMIECMCFCHINKIKFVLYADDANFADGRGWEEFFEPFCEQNHDRLNKKVNRRRVEADSKLFRWRRGNLLKRTCVDYLTDDFFVEFISREFKEKKICWPLLDMDGNVYPEMAKLTKLALRYNEETYRQIVKKIEKLQLPEHYYSIQIRGGDKIYERTKLFGAKEAIEKIETYKISVNDLFVFTDDYKNIKEFKQLRPDWNIYTLTQREETGYNNGEFNAKSWKYKKDNLIKLFAMVEVCIASDFHFGCEQSCANNIIKNSKKDNMYLPIVLKDEYLRQ